MVDYCVHVRITCRSAKGDRSLFLFRKELPHKSNTEDPCTFLRQKLSGFAPSTMSKESSLHRPGQITAIPRMVDQEAVYEKPPVPN